jgi:hypothetical protein
MQSEPFAVVTPTVSFHPVMRFLRSELVADRGVPESVGVGCLIKRSGAVGSTQGVISTRGFVLLLQEDNHDQAELSQKVQTLHTACCNPLGSTWRIESGYHCISPSTGKMRRKRWNSINRISRVPQFWQAVSTRLSALRIFAGPSIRIAKELPKRGRGGWINDSDLAFPEAALRPAILRHHRLE